MSCKCFGFCDFDCTLLQMDVEKESDAVRVEQSLLGSTFLPKKYQLFSVGK